ncbi:FlgD immunoglobulin-like domain containing protein [Candidatus Eisenbacteria bacterium]|uniref:FlgD immunoglobulin-like domain containing protein n=1 Tax=Eiseniibacteriota bacterium TaxID=2212470 RepID=A0ABV6YIQ5_UNCEI
MYPGGSNVFVENRAWRVSGLFLGMLLLGLSLSSAGASESDLSGGVFIAHYVPEIVNSEPPEGWCGQYDVLYKINDHSEQNNRIDTETYKWSAWYVLSGFCGYKEFCGCQFGVGQYGGEWAFDNASTQPCWPPGDTPSGLELPSPGWPGPGEGTAITSTSGPWIGNYAAVYLITGYAYGYGEMGVVPLDVNGQTSIGGWTNCQGVPEEFVPFIYGGMGVNMDGLYAEPVCPGGPEWACCLNDGSCRILTEAECNALDGVWHENVICDSGLCPQPFGACCYPDGSCQYVQEDQCGTGDWTMFEVCDPNPCPQPFGACCYPDGTCQYVQEDQCGTGDWTMFGVCDPNPCVDVLCCLPDGQCVTLLSGDCSLQDGTPVLDCLFCIPPGQNCFTTMCGNALFDFCHSPIPADFFAPGSEPFEGRVVLGGSGDPFGDTVVERLNSMALDEVGETADVIIELVGLDLVSCDPIRVVIDGGDTYWDVEVTLSSTPVPLGLMQIAKTHENGGTFDSEYFVQPLFIFTREDMPTEVRVFDTGVEGISPQAMRSITPGKWVHQPEGDPGPECWTPGFLPSVNGDPNNLPGCTTETQCCESTGHSSRTGLSHITGRGNCTVCECGACCFENGACTVVTASDLETAEEVCLTTPGAIEYKGAGSSCADTDGDGIPSWFESNDCCDPDRDVCNTGTDPRDPDTDDDGLLDRAELVLGCDPCVPDDCPPTEVLLPNVSLHEADFAIELGWRAPLDAVGVRYEVYRGTNADPASAHRLATVESDGLRMTYRDESVSPGESYWYWVDFTETSGDHHRFGPWSITFAGSSRPVLLDNAPSPAREQSRIRFYIPETSNASLEIYSANGSRVRSIQAIGLGPGIQNFVWDRTDQTGRLVPAGVYFYKVFVGSAQLGGKKLIVLR